MRRFFISSLLVITVAFIAYFSWTAVTNAKVCNNVLQSFADKHQFEATGFEYEKYIGEPEKGKFSIMHSELFEYGYSENFVCRFEAENQSLVLKGYVEEEHSLLIVELYDTSTRPLTPEQITTIWKK